MLTLRWETEYALLMISHIAQKGHVVSIASMADSIGIPKKFAATIGAKLSAVGILTSKEGRTGGYTMGLPLHKIRMYDVVSLFESGMRVVSCENDEFDCPLEHSCAHASFFRSKFSHLISNEMKKWTLKDLYADNSKSD